MELVADLTAAGYERGIGPGVWDIHSPRVPAVTEMTEALSRCCGRSTLTGCGLTRTAA